MSERSERWAKENPERMKELRRRWYLKWKASQPVKERKPKKTEEELKQANLERYRQWAESNRDKNLAIKRKYYHSHKEECGERGKRYYQENLEKIKERTKRNKRWQFQDKEVKRQKQREWNRENKHKSAEYRHRREQRVNQNGGDFTAEQFTKLCDAFGNVCLKCGEAKPLTVDHIVPVSRGGSNDISNIQPLCISCNSSKRCETIDYRPFVPELASSTCQ